MIARSWLLVPGDAEARLTSAGESGAHAIIVDLCEGDGAADGMAPHSRTIARTMGRDWLHAHRRQVLENRRLARWVRVNAIDTGLWRDDLAAVMPTAPDGIILPRTAGPDDVRQLAAEIYELEQRHQVPNGTTRIVPMMGETPAAALGIAAYVDFTMPRLAGLGWHSAPLMAAMGAPRTNVAGGGSNDVTRMVRAQALLIAHARNLWAIEMMDGQGDAAASLSAAQGARVEGFAGMIARDAGQVAPINAAFAPTSDELANARAIVGAFAASPYAERLPVNGRMIDQPRLKAAKALLGVE